MSTKKITIMEDTYDEDTYTAMIKVRYDDKEVCKYAKMNQEDIDKGYPASEYFGKDIAFLKCILHIAREEINQEKMKLAVLENLLVTTSDLRNYKEEKNTQVARHLRKQIYMKRKAIAEYEENYEYNKAIIQKMIEQREEDSKQFVMFTRRGQE